MGCEAWPSSAWGSLLFGTALTFALLSYINGTVFPQLFPTST